MLRVHSYESMGTFDGPGLRLVVFLQGCPFRCLYCANPDTIDARGESTETALDHILQMAIDQRPFFGRRGGITFSGGEPTVQARELIPLVERLREEGIHVALDSNGALDGPDVDRLYSLANLVLLDVKHIDPEGHRRLTGADVSRPLAAARRLEAMGTPVWLRYVLVPGINADPATIERWGRELGPLKNVERVEILPYHTLGAHKYAAMGLPYTLEGTPRPTPDQLEQARAILAPLFACPVIVN